MFGKRVRSKRRDFSQLEHPNQFLIEGVDRMGKSTLIQGLLDNLGYHLVIHYDKPKKLKFYDSSLASYQYSLYCQMFNLIESDHKLVMDRAHLGEVVYAPIYRNYSGHYVYEIEKWTHTDNARLVLLVTSDFSFIQDDGKSLDFAKKEMEQDRFIEAFHKSSIKDKIMIDVSNGQGGYRSAESILNEVLKKECT